MPRKKGKGKGRTISVDMSDSGGSFKCRDGIYGATVDKITQEESQDGNDYLTWYLDLDNGSKVLHNTSLLPQALWNLRQTLEACGMEVPESTLELELDDLAGVQLGVEIENEVYNKKRRPYVVDTFPFDELEDRVEESGGNEPNDEPEEEPEDENQDAVEADQDDSVVVGSNVTCDDGDVGVVTDIDGDIATVDVDGTNYEVELDSLTLSDEDIEESEPEPEKELELAEGCTVTFDDDGDEYEGVVTKLSKKKCEVDVEEDGEIATWELKPDDVTVTEVAE